MPEREDIHRNVMQMYFDLERPDDAMNQYRLLERHLDGSVGVEPSSETRQLYDKILASTM